VLTLKLAHYRTVAEVELRLRRDLAEELLAGTDTHSAETGAGHWAMAWAARIAWW
jgi:hypothetical protein